ncbi:MAG: DUF484 family protein [Methylococcales bacterium]|nr:DUF484 family protein [Methylococcales bacterium]
MNEQEAVTSVKKIKSPKSVKSKAIKKIVSKKAVVINDEQVAAFLEENPDFFTKHIQLLENMSIPHPSGGAVSLISKQLELFRGRYLDMENQLIELIDIARDNDTAVNRMHKLNLALLDAKTLDEVVTNLNLVLSEYFLTDYAAIRIIQLENNTEYADIFISPESNDLKAFARELSYGLPRCGQPTLTQARVLFGFNANEVKSCAIIPMLFTEIEGLLAIGSRDENRFHASMGHLFLTQMSEVIATRLITLLKNN